MFSLEGDLNLSHPITRSEAKRKGGTELGNQEGRLIGRQGGRDVEMLKGREEQN